MTLPLYLTTGITAVFFTVLYLLLSSQPKSPLKLFSLGGLVWSIIGIFQYFVLGLLYLLDNNYNLVLESSVFTYSNVVLNFRTITFWYLVLVVLIGEILRYFLVNQEYLGELNMRTLLITGLGWGTAEYLTRFLIFFEKNNLVKSLQMFFLIILTNVFLTMLMIRTIENNKFVMFAAFNKYFIELAIFGLFGRFRTEQIDILALWLVVLLGCSLMLLSLLTKLFDTEDDELESNEEENRTEEVEEELK